MSFLQEIRTHGLLVRERFYEKDHLERFKVNQDLISYMKLFPRVQFRTVRDYVSGELVPGGRSLQGMAGD
jgi:hypothetical protein